MDLSVWGHRCVCDRVGEGPNLTPRFEKGKIEFDPARSEKLQQVIAEAANIPPTVLARARAARGM